MNHHTIAFIALLLSGTFLGWLIVSAIREARLPKPRQFTRYLLIGSCLWLSSCATTGTTSALTTALSSVVSNPNDASAISAAETAFVNTAAASGDFTKAYALVSGIASTYQAYVGTGTVPPAVASTSAGNAAVGAAVASPLSSAPATQSVANALFTIASQIAANSGASLNIGRHYNLSGGPSRMGVEKLCYVRDSRCLVTKATERARPAQLIFPDLFGDWTMVAKLNQPRF